MMKFLNKQIMSNLEFDPGTNEYVVQITGTERKVMSMTKRLE